MTQNPTRIQVKCVSCQMGVRLTEEQYRELLKRSRVALNCPHCANSFEYDLVPTRTAANPTPSPRSRQLKAEAPSETDRAQVPSELPPVEAPPSAPAYPPPPFAPLKAGTPAPFNVDPPPFAPLADKPFAQSSAAPYSQGMPASTGGEAKKLTLNERWNQLPPWVQWTAIGVMIVVLAVVIFAIPTGGRTGPAEPGTSGSHEHTPVKPEKDGKKAREKPATEDKAAKEREP